MGTEAQPKSFSCNTRPYSRHNLKWKSGTYDFEAAQPGEHTV